MLLLQRRLQLELVHQGVHLTAQLDSLPSSFFARDARIVARALIGTQIVVLHEAKTGGPRLGRIVETEAYRGPTDLASHARFGVTKRTRSMFLGPGHAYVFFVYGMHECFNVTCPARRRGARGAGARGRAGRCAAGREAARRWSGAAHARARDRPATRWARRDRRRSALAHLAPSAARSRTGGATEDRRERARGRRLRGGDRGGAVALLRPGEPAGVATSGERHRSREESERQRVTVVQRTFAEPVTAVTRNVTAAPAAAHTGPAAGTSERRRAPASTGSPRGPVESSTTATLA